MAKRSGQDALSNVQAHFKDVVDVTDAKRPLVVEITAADVSVSERKGHRTCAAATACRRKFRLDGVIMSRTTAYMIRKAKAVRYSIPMALQKEIVSFDRGGSFAPGTYMLRVPWHKLGMSKPKGRGPKKLKAKRWVRHSTAGIRANLISTAV